MKQFFLDFLKWFFTNYAVKTILKILLLIIVIVVGAMYLNGGI